MKFGLLPRDLEAKVRCLLPELVECVAGEVGSVANQSNVICIGEVRESDLPYENSCVCHCLIEDPINGTTNQKWGQGTSLSYP